MRSGPSNRTRIGLSQYGLSARELFAGAVMPRDTGGAFEIKLIGAVVGSLAIVLLPCSPLAQVQGSNSADGLTPQMTNALAPSARINPPANTQVPPLAAEDQFGDSRTFADCDLPKYPITAHMSPGDKQFYQDVNDQYRTSCRDRLEAKQQSRSAAVPSFDAPPAGAFNVQSEQVTRDESASQSAPQPSPPFFSPSPPIADSSYAAGGWNDPKATAAILFLVIAVIATLGIVWSLSARALSKEPGQISIASGLLLYLKSPGNERCLPGEFVDQMGVIFECLNIKSPQDIERRMMMALSMIKSQLTRPEYELARTLFQRWDWSSFVTSSLDKFVGVESVTAKEPI